jgi:hypothetical protein
VIGYIDLNGQFGNGSFTFVPEPAPLGPIAICSIMIVCSGPVLATRGTGSNSAREAPCAAIRIKCLWRLTPHIWPI